MGALNDFDPIGSALAPTTPDAVPREGVMVAETAAGGYLVLPASVRRLDGLAAEIAQDLQVHAARLHEMHRRLDALVLDGRDAGLSWSVIGFLVGLTDEGARKRWGDVS